MTDRDPVIVAVLDRSDPPQHRAGFWADLDARLADLGPPAAPDGRGPIPGRDAEDAEPVPVVPLTEAEIEERRAGRRALVLSGFVAAAVLLVVGLTYGVDLLDDRSIDSPANAAGSSGNDEAGAFSTTTYLTRSVPDAELAEAERLVLAFLDAIAAGDVEVAAAMVGPVSEQHADEELGGLLDLLRVSAEGHGAWSSAEDREVTTVGVEPGLAVVVLEGTLSLEGTLEHRIAAFPVRRAEAADTWLVEPWADDIEAPIVEITAPDIDEEERTVLPVGVTEVEYRIDPAPTGEPATVWEAMDGEPYPPDVTSEPLSVSSGHNAVGDRSVVVLVAWEQGPTVGATAFRIDRPDATDPVPTTGSDN